MSPNLFILRMPVKTFELPKTFKFSRNEILEIIVVSFMEFLGNKSAVVFFHFNIFYQIYDVKIIKLLLIIHPFIVVMLQINDAF